MSKKGIVGAVRTASPTTGKRVWMWRGKEYDTLREIVFTNFSSKIIPTFDKDKNNFIPTFDSKEQEENKEN